MASGSAPRDGRSRHPWLGNLFPSQLCNCPRAMHDVSPRLTLFLCFFVTSMGWSRSASNVSTV